MKPVNQTIFTVPGGNCLQASLASVLELPLDEVPHFANIETDDWWFQCQDWCAQFGVYPVYLPVEGVGEPYQLQGYHLIHVLSPKGTPHSVVGRRGKVVHDPMGVVLPEYNIEGYTIFVSTMENIPEPTPCA